MKQKSLKTFIIYSSKDKKFRIKLENHLRHLVDRELIELWSDKEILPGENWDKSIEKELLQADIFLLLVSVDFYNSGYIREKEFKIAVDRNNLGQALIIPIIVHPCDWQNYPVIMDLQVLPTGGIPISDSSWKRSDKAWENVAKTLADRVKKMHHELVKDIHTQPTAPTSVTIEIEKLKQGKIGAEKPQTVDVIREPFSIFKLFSSKNDNEKSIKKMVDSIIQDYNKNIKISQKNIDSLATLAAEIPSGNIKNIFLEHCERLIEHILRLDNLNNESKSIIIILEYAVCFTIIYEGVKSTFENRQKALDILSLVYYQYQHKEHTSYLTNVIARCIKEIGKKSMLMEDFNSVIDAIEKLSIIEDSNSSQAIYLLGSNSIEYKHFPTIVIAIRKLSRRLRNERGYDRHRFNHDYYYWLGLLSNTYNLGGSVLFFVERELNTILREPILLEDIRNCFTDTQNYFYRQADFATVDSIRRLEDHFFRLP